jgi:Tol biopolymer transport system component
MNESKLSLTTKVARVAIVLVGLVAVLAALQALSGQPAHSASNSKIAFHSDRDGDYEVFTMNPDGSLSSLRQLTFNSFAADRWPG